VPRICRLRHLLLDSRSSGYPGGPSSKISRKNIEETNRAADVDSYREGVPRSRTCIFCSRNPQSREDLWSQWILRLFPSGTLMRWDFRTPRGESTQTTTRRTLKIWGPCEPCNNGWMSRVETATKPLLAAMVRGEKVELGRHDQLTLATWATMKEMVSEFQRGHSRLQVRVNRPEDRLILLEQGRPPATTRVRVAACEVGNVLSYHRALVFGERTPGSGYEYAACTTFTLGHAVLQILTAPHSPFRAFRDVGVVRDVDISAFPMSYEGVAWPPARRLASSEMVAYTQSVFDVGAEPPRIRSVHDNDERMP
jgi:hypothetical protein